jgi:hypothetical protein
VPSDLNCRIDKNFNCNDSINYKTIKIWSELFAEMNSIALLVVEAYYNYRCLRNDKFNNPAQ